MSDRKPTTVLVRIIGGEEYDDCAPELLAEDVMPGSIDGVVWEIVPDEITRLRAALADERKRALEEITDLRAALVDERERSTEAFAALRSLMETTK